MQATVKYPRLAAVLIDIEKKTGRTRAEIGRLAGRDGSAATRWAKGTHLPSWSAAKSLADAIGGEAPDLADGLLAAWHYYSDPVEQGPDSTIPAEVLRVIRKSYPPELQREAITMLQQLNGPTGQLEEAERESRRDDGRAG